MRGDRFRLLADIGGTNVRFALADANGLTAGGRRPVVDFPSFEAALADYLNDVGVAPGGAAIAAAGPRESGRVQLTNSPWIVDRAEVAAMLGGVPVALLNDLEATAHALPHLAPADVAEVFAGAASADLAPRLAFNVGTGLGAALLVSTPHGPRAVATEAGHMRFAPVTAAEAALGEWAITYEDVLSGRGWRRLMDVISTTEARRRVFSALVGRVAGDLVLATGAWAGIWFCGGVFADWDGKIDASEMRRAFQDKGPMQARMQAVPMTRILLESPALIGLAHAPIDDS